MQTIAIHHDAARVVRTLRLRRIFDLVARLLERVPAPPPEWFRYPPF